MDTLGATLGPLAALLMLRMMPEAAPDYRFIFMAAFVPALLGVLVLVFLVREASPVDPSGKNGPAAERAPMSSDFRTFVVLYAVFAIGNSNDAFLILKAKQSGFSTTHVILAYTAYNLVYALTAAPAGWLSDKLGKIRTMSFGFLIFASVYMGFAYAEKGWIIWGLFALYGFYGAFKEGIAKAVVSHLSGAGNRAAGMGYFQGTMGFLTFFASFMAGLLWDKVSPAAPFIAGAACAALSMLGLLVWTGRRRLSF
ncbi:MAG TPA: MFS transporter [Elusimicrobiales bacterium]|nr:MFS transporter [Elusimicrobiales bacterium]